MKVADRVGKKKKKKKKKNDFLKYFLFIYFFKSFNRKPSGFDWRLNGIGDIRDVTALIVPNVRTFYAAQRINQFNFGHYKKWVIDVDKCSCYRLFYVCYYQRRKKASQSLNSVWQWSLASKRVSLHNLNIRTLLMFKFHR